MISILSLKVFATAPVPLNMSITIFTPLQFSSTIFITPLYIFYPELTIAPDRKAARVVFKQAARIVGMEYTVRLVYENGDYYVEDWERFIDGSYLNKFDHISYSLDWYYDIVD